MAHPSEEPVLTPFEEELLAALEGDESYDELALRLQRPKSSLYNIAYEARRKLKRAAQRKPAPEQD
jgi:DNA-directed RNA polymerase specialized sigma24 family protein